MASGLTTTQKLLELLQLLILVVLALSGLGLAFAWLEGSGDMAWYYFLPVFVSALFSLAGVRVGMAIVVIALSAVAIRKLLTEWPRSQ